MAELLNVFKVIYGLHRQAYLGGTAADRWIERADEVFHNPVAANDYAEYADALPAMFVAALESTGETKHSDDLDVDRFATAMKTKLALKRADGRSGWDGPDCDAAVLSRLLREHVEKGDPLDVGNLAMMLHQRGERIACARQPGQRVKPLVWEATGFPDEWRAGDYQIWREPRGYQLLFWSIVEGEHHENLEAAQAVAWKHHKARILASLEPAAPPVADSGATPDLSQGWLIHKAGRGWYPPKHRDTPAACHTAQKSYFEIVAEHDPLKAEVSKAQEER